MVSTCVYVFLCVPSRQLSYILHVLENGWLQVNTVYTLVFHISLCTYIMSSTRAHKVLLDFLATQVPQVPRVQMVQMVHEV